MKNFKPETIVVDDIKHYYWDVDAEHRVLNVYLRGLDQLLLITNLFSSVIPPELKKAKYFLEKNQCFLRVDLTDFEDIVPSISPKFYRELLPYWKKINVNQEILF